MKANRKFVESREAVSAVIGVILMVAITVAIAAVVYVWVTSFGGGGTPAPSMSISQEKSASGENHVNFTVLSASGNAKWSDLSVIVGGEEYTRNDTGSVSINPGNWTYTGGDDSVTAGETLIVRVSSGDDVVGKTLQILHVPSNTIIVTRTIY